MVEHRLYGVNVLCNFSLFAHNLVPPNLLPGQEQAISLLPWQESIQAPALAREYPLYTTHGRFLMLRTDRELALSVAQQHWCLNVEGVVSFRWSGAESLIHFQLHEHGTQDLLVFWFVHIFLPLYLTLERGYDFIHSAAVEIAGKPVLFIAPSTGGKSTLADYFLQRGHAMLSDDKVATFLHNGRYVAVPSHPHHRPFRALEELGYPIENFAQSAKPIHAFYVLEKGDADSQVAIEEVQGFQKFEQLLPHYLFSFRFLQQQRMRWLAQLADQSLVFRVRRPWDLAKMPAVYKTISSHAEGL